MTTTRIDLLRHGLPEGDECFRGHTDFALTKKGAEQMHAALEKNAVYDLVITSPLKRCRSFAFDYAKQNDLKVVQDPEVMELDFGDWDGMTKQAVWEYDSSTLSKFWSDPWATVPPNGESLEEYDVRIQCAWQRILDAYKGKRILLVTHGGVIKQVMRFVLDMPKSEVYLQRLTIPYAAKVSITVYHDNDGRHWPELHWPTTN